MREMKRLVLLTANQYKKNILFYNNMFCERVMLCINT